LSLCVLVMSALLLKDKTFALSLVVILAVVSCSQSHSMSSQSGKIVVKLPLDANLDELVVIVNEVVLVADDLRDICTSGAHSNNLRQCAGLLCHAQDSECLLSGSSRVGALILTGESTDKAHLASLQQAANSFGPQLGWQMIVSSPSTTNEELIRNAQKLYDHGCRYFVGPLYSGEALTLEEWSKGLEQHVYFISPSASSRDLSSFNNLVSLFTNNDEFGKALSNFIAYALKPGGQTFYLYTIREDGAYVQDLLAAVKTVSGPMRFEVVDAAVYPAGLNSQQAEQALNNLTEEIQASENKDSSFILHLGFGQDLATLYEAADDRHEGLFERLWFSSDAAFDDAVVSSEASRDRAVMAGLTSMHYMGYNYDNAASVRNEMLQAVYNASGEINMFCPFIHDSAMLMYLTLQRMGDLSDEGALFPSNVRDTARSVYGATGLLELTPDGFRRMGEYLQGFVDIEKPVDMPWTAATFILYDGYGLEPLSLEEELSFDSVKYHVFDVNSMNCTTNRVVLQCYDYLGRMISRDFKISADGSSGELYIPKFSTLTVNVYCLEDRLGIFTCPGNPRSENARCLQATRQLEEVSKAMEDVFTPSSVFNAPVEVHRKSDNMFDSYVGAHGTTIWCPNASGTPNQQLQSFP